MSEEHEGEPRPPSETPFTQDVRMASVGARVPEHVRRGVFVTGSTVLQTGDVFVVDFLSTMVAPHQVAARVVLTVPTFTQLIAALKQNLAKYEEQYGHLEARTPLESPKAPDPGAAGAPGAGNGGTAAAVAEPGVPAEKEPPREPGQAAPQTDVGEFYERLKLPDEMLGGVFASVVMIRHTPEEFCFDFITNFFPRSVVTSRVYMAAGRVPAFLKAMSESLQNYRAKRQREP